MQCNQHVTMSHSVYKAASGHPFHAALLFEGDCLLPWLYPLKCSTALAHST